LPNAGGGDEQAMNGLAINSSSFFSYLSKPDEADFVSTIGMKASISMEEIMRRILLAMSATAAVLAAASLAPTSASAMALSSPAAIGAAIDTGSLAQDVAYVCRRVRVCGPYGCGWRRSCFWTGPRYRYRHWRRHHWRRW
jgi:hypothetical protein